MTNPPDFSDDLRENPDENSSPGASDNGKGDDNNFSTEHKNDATPLAGESGDDPSVASPLDPGPPAADLPR